MQKKDDKLAVGIVGCGTHMSQVYTNIFPNVSGATIKYVTDLNRELAEQTARSMGVLAVDFESLIEGADIVLIASPPHTHYHLVKQTLEVGKTVICEKPFVTMLTEAHELITLAEDCGVSLYVAHMRRLYPSVKLAKRIAEENRFGKLKKIYIHEGSRYTLSLKSNYLVKEKSGGVIFDIGSHTLDMALYMGLLSDDEIAISIDEIARDKFEPSHHINGKFHIMMGTDSIECEFVISRVTFLSNKITFIYENGRMDVPTGLSDRLRISSAGNSEIVIADKKISQMQVYYNQIEAILSKSDDHLFSAHQFINLTNLIETIATSEGEINIE